MDETPKKPLACPVCGRTDVRPSYPAGLRDTLARWLAYYPFRCRACRNRFYRHGSTLETVPPPPPTL